MTVLGDSAAIRTDGRQLAQHQAALTILQQALSDPGTDDFAWLDLGCGRGQILTGLSGNLSDGARAKISFSAYDVKQDYVLETQRLAETLGLASRCIHVGNLSDFDRIIPSEQRFDFITLTNTVHEVAAERLADVLVDAVGRLSGDGILFLYDMERVKPPELGALPFSASNFEVVAETLIRSLGENDYRPEVGQWQHSTVRGWNLQIQREHISASPEELQALRAQAVKETSDAIRAVLSRRLKECHEALEALTIYGTETVKEQEDREHFLHELWAITRALETDR